MITLVIVDLIINELQKEAQETRSLNFMDDPYTDGRTDGLEVAIKIIGEHSEDFEDWRKVFKSFLSVNYTIEESEKLADASFIIQ